MKYTLLSLFLVVLVLQPVTADQFGGRSRTAVYPSTIQFGIEPVTSNSVIEGGAYMYAQLSADIIRNFTFMVKYSTEVTPDLFKNHLFSAYTKINLFFYGDEMAAYGSIAPSYTFYTDFKNIFEHNGGVRICLATVGTMTENYSIEILPFEIGYTISKKEFYYRFELFNIGFRF